MEIDFFVGKVERVLRMMAVNDEYSFVWFICTFVSRKLRFKYTEL
jgi:hypothetical protein